jgi:7,8-dihydropterin-6-yl-methyl-4-(beta-D-ribofuranosyl)aminobenzene 5'-phosphate synthase
MKINEVDKVEVLTLQDNYVDFLAFKENNHMVQRPIPITPTERGMELSQPPKAEHGWSSLISVSAEGSTNQLLFDFGWSKQGAAQNAELLNMDLHQIDLIALSHGHIDHFGGMKALYNLIDKPGIELIVQPAAFRNPRYGKVMGDKKIFQPCLTMDMLSEIGVTVKLTETPLSLIDNKFLFPTGILRKTAFETGMPDVFYLDGDEEKPDHIDDDSSIVISLI